MTETITLDEFHERYGGRFDGVGPAAGANATDWERELGRQIDLADFPKPAHDTVEPVPGRGFRLDFAWESVKVGIEVQGGSWLQTKNGRSAGHAHPTRYREDIEKLNEAQLAGWLILWATPNMIEDGRALAWIERALEGRSTA